MQDHKPYCDLMSEDTFDYARGCSCDAIKPEWPDPKDLKDNKYVGYSDFEDGKIEGALLERKEVLTALHSGGVEALRELVKGWIK